jgi:Poly(R)-hydroxyalkanoic acid synthase subunit (PHA_synth_III_E)
VTEKPPWRVAIEQFERSIGAPLEAFVQTDEFADMAARAAKSQAQIQHGIGTDTSQWPHAMNLPTATDVAELRAEIAELRKEVRSLAEGLVPAKTAPAMTAPAKRAPVSTAPAESAPARTTPAKRAPAKKATAKKATAKKATAKKATAKKATAKKATAKKATSSARPAAKRTQTAGGRAKSE